MKEEPQNKDGQAPTRSAPESVDRLEHKKFDQIGTANRAASKTRSSSSVGSSDTLAA